MTEDVTINFLYSDPNYINPPEHLNVKWRLKKQNETIQHYIEQMIDHITCKQGMQKYAYLVSNSFGKRMVIYMNHPVDPKLGADAADFVDEMCANRAASVFNF